MRGVYLPPFVRLALAVIPSSCDPSLSFTQHSADTARSVRSCTTNSIGHSAIFLIGGPTRSTPPLAIRLDSGDGVIMSGRRGRRVFHGLPRVVPGSLPEYLKAGSEDRQHHDDPGVGEDVGARAGTGIREDRAEGEDQSGGSDDWRLFGEYLERGARINVNVRTVFS